MQMQTLIPLDDLAQFIRTGFRSDQDLQTGAPRAIGLKNEYVLVSADGTIMPPIVLEYFWNDLIALQWEAIFDENSQTIIGVKKERLLSSVRAYAFDIITTGLGYSVLEINLAPAQSLHEAHEHLRALLRTITSILERYQTYVLGYGVQPAVEPDPFYLGHSNRYKMLWDICNAEYQNSNHAYLLDLQAIDAACQTQIEVSANEVIPVMNALNATAGLRIALLANSPVWRQHISGYQAIRQLFVEWCWPSRGQQVGIPPRFWDLKHYIDYLLDFRAMFVKREQKVYRINNQIPFRQFFADPEGLPGVTIDGYELRVFGELQDIYTQNNCAWFCARPQPVHGTIEDRVSCQQPPRESLCASALTLGLVENYQELASMANILSLDQWRDIRFLASKDALNMCYPAMDLYASLKHMLDIAQRGLLKRGMDEDIFLAPLYRRLEQQRGPADVMQTLFGAGGIDAVVAHSDMRMMC